MKYLVVHKEPLVIFDELSIPIPYSEPLESKLAALQWMVVRGLQHQCTIMPESQFKALGGK